MSTTDQPPKLKRRWYRFSLLTLLISVVVSSAGIGWVGMRMIRARTNREQAAASTVGQIEAMGASVVWSEPPRSPNWLEELFDDPGRVDDSDSVLHITRVNFRYHPATDADLMLVERMPNLVDLRFQARDLTDDGLERLKGLTNLTHLRMYRSGGNITDDGVVHLKDLTNLEDLFLSDTNITDAGLVHLRRMTRLKVLSVRDAKITDAGLEHLKELDQLEYLDLRRTNIGDAGVERLKGLTNLRELHLSGTLITSVGLEYLKDLTRLETLCLSDTKVTDIGLEHLKGLKSLEELYLLQTNVTDDGVKKLQQALPKCGIGR